MMVMMTAMTPSENASTRALENEPSELDMGVYRPSYAISLSEALGKREIAVRRTVGRVDTLTQRSPAASQRLSRVWELDSGCRDETLHR
jgi:hypothetical protein